ncbi:ricin-type beta-trefoil lectin domain protein [Kitasatospora sp. NPDC005748]|uniref:ricin-type beta-trefoil lectin domain protein n=1 Tax=Kitasatospora sp. NPDC005748 TaxID=3157063 RepID=UPI0033E61857
MTITALTAALSLVVPLTGYGVAWTARAADQDAKSPLPELPTVGGRDADKKRKPEQLPHPAGSHDLQPFKADPVQWPPPATITVDLKNRPDIVGGKNGTDTAVRAGSTPVLLGTHPTAPASPATTQSTAGNDPQTPADGAPGAVEVKVADRAQAQQANVDGLLVGLKRSDGGKDAAGLDVSLDYSSIADAYGGGYASRLRLVTMPDCALTTPQLAECRTRTPIDTTLDPATKRITGRVVLPGDTAAPAQASPAHGSLAKGAPTEAAPATALSPAPAPAGGGTALAAVPDVGGSQGSYTATDLSSSGSWTQSASGAFTYSYPISVPPSVGGEAPGVDLAYNSQSVDGSTSARNSQASWIGDGWSYSPGFVERSYKSCQNSGIDGSGDQCWTGWSATLSLGSHSGELVRDDTGVYHLLSDDGTRIERLTGAANGLWQGEYFKVTTTEGTAYYFGLNHAPGTTSDGATNSAWGTPVYHPNSADPCYTAAKGKNSQCDQQPGWRFNLDFVVDPNGNLQRYDWATETNRYAMGAGQAAKTGGTGTLTPYTRGGYLSRVSYGYQLADAVAGREPSARVTFNTAERCVVSDTTCRPENLSATTAKDWPDVPYDLACPEGWVTSGTGANVCWIGSPTFWSTKRLLSIGTELRTQGGWQNVDRYDLKHIFSKAGAIIDPATGKPGDPNYGDGSLQSVMWLSEIRHTALDTSAGGAGPITLDPVTFAGTELNNRVDGLDPPAPPLYRPRIIGINTESGTQVTVTYRDPECSRTKGVMPASADSNTLACYPVYWTPPRGAAPIADWFHKTLVAKVTAADNTTAASPARETSYSYSGGAAWHRDDSDLTDDKYRTWNEFRGYRTVTTTTGAANGPDPLGQTSVSYFQGMDQDRRADGTLRSIKLRTSAGEEATDSAWLSGTPQEAITYREAGGPAIAKQLTGMSTADKAIATRKRSAWSSDPKKPLSTLPDLEARRPKSSEARSSTLLADGTWRTARTSTTYDELGRAATVEAQPDVTSADNRSCTTTLYAAAPASNPMMLAYPSAVKTVAGACGTAASATTVVNDRQVVYDGSDDPKNPGVPGVLGQNGRTFGYPTATQNVTAYDAQGKAVYQTLAAQAYDGYGRVVRSVDATNGVNTSSYSPATGVLPSEVSTVNALNWRAKSVVSPARGLVTQAVDANDRVTDSTYDALGRRTAVWLPGNARAKGRPADRTFEYDTHGVSTDPNSRAPAPTVTTRALHESGNWETSVTIYDGFLQPRQTQSMPANGAAGRVLTHTRYDSLGQVTKSTATWYDKDHGGPSTTLFEERDSDAPSQTRFLYDGAGRKTANVLYSRGQELWRTSTAYPGADLTVSTPPSGGTPSTVYTDALGRTTSSVLHGGSATGDVTTRYTYDQRGQLATIQDDAHNTWSYGYDIQGRRVSQTDPDTGSSATSYDEFGRVAKTTDGRGTQLSFTYDQLGRVTGRYAGDRTDDPGKLLASFTYDTPAKGYPTSSTRYVGGANGDAYVQKVNGYTERYQPTGTTTTIPAGEGKLAGDYSQTLWYQENLGLPSGVTYGTEGNLPAEDYGYSRNDLGYVVGTRGRTTTLHLANYDPLGRILRSQFGAENYLLRSGAQYDDITGRLTKSDVMFQEADANPVSSTSYGYDQAGNLAYTSELQSSGGIDQTFDTQCFHYDGLNRLVEAWTDTWGVTQPTAGAVSRCNNADPGPATIGGPAPYWQTYQYNQLGDRTQQVKHDVTGDTARDITQTSHYPGEGRVPAAKPNTVTNVTTRTGKATVRLTSGQTADDGTALCMDVWGARTSDGTPVGTWTCHDGGSEKWTRPGDGTLRALGKCARPVGGNGFAGAKVELVTCDGSNSQQWTDGADGALVHSSTFCLEIPGANGTPGTQLGLWACNGLAHQRWPATVNGPSGPDYTASLTPQYDAQGNTTSRSTTATTTLPSALPTGTTPLCLDATGATNTNGTPVETWTCHEGGAQQWTLDTDGTLRVLGACARPVDGKATEGAQLELWACDGSDSQRWHTAADGSLVHESGMCVDIPWSSTTPGARVTLWTCNQAAANQKWGDHSSKPTNGAGQAFTYDLEGRTKTVTTADGTRTKTSSYLYDASGTLLVQRGAEGTILYLFGGAEQIILSADGTTVSGNRYYPQPDGTTAVRSSAGALTYQFHNPQNTSSLQVDAATRAITRRSFDPYGAPRGPLPATWSDNRGYLGQPLDGATGLNLLGARNYDATLGRFLTADPVLMAGDANQMGGYTYASNNPVNLTDADGLWPKWVTSAVKSVGKTAAGFVDQAVGYITVNSFYAAGNNILSGVNEAVGQQTGVPVFPGITPMQTTEHPIADLVGIPHDDPYYVAGEVIETVVELGADGVGLIKGAKAATQAIKNAGGIRKALTSLFKGAPKVEPTRPTAPKTAPSDPKPPATPKAEPTPPEEPLGTPCSFTPDTPVLMADGSTKPIAAVTPGDRVEAADQWTGKDQDGRTVTAKWSHEDDDLVDVTVKASGVTTTIKTTSNHPFWDDTTHDWVMAGDLTVGHALTTPDGQPVTITAVHALHGQARMYSLTVTELHTYYVLAGTTPVLVHNCGEVAVDTNAVTDALSGAKTAEVDAALAGRAPVLSPTAHRELLEGGHSAEGISSWLSARGGRMGPASTSDGVSSLQARLRAMWKGKSFNPMIADDDASVLHSAIQDGLSIITNDKRFYKNIDRLGYSSERY